MQFRIWPALGLFLGSYLPLAIILMVQDISRPHWGSPICGWAGKFECQFQVFDHPWLALGSVIISLAALAMTVVSIKAVKMRHRVHVQEVKSTPNDLINYVFPYVVSFMGLDYDDPQKLAGFAVFLLALFVITYRSGQILMNPLLIVLGWRLYEVKMAIGQQGAIRIARVLKRGALVPGIQHAEEVQDVYLMGDP